MLAPTEVIDLTQDSPVMVRQGRIHHRQRANQQHDEYSVPRDRNIDEIVRLIDEYDIEYENETRTQSTNFQCTKDKFKTNNTSSFSDEEQNLNVPTRRNSLGSSQRTLECPICLDSLFSRKPPITTTCGHIYCCACLESLFKESDQAKCPKCNRRVTKKSCIRLYF